ncbi:MAG: alpha/beta hydrolase [Bacteroidia bacterium]|nr:alpha/beta hydrolase [Bacteroidia bacterium]
MNKEITIYLISGLGADERAFRKLVFPDSFKIKHIKWISPEKCESLSSYVRRLSDQIDIANPFILIGLSFGGIIVNELTTFTKPIKSIVISSLQSRNEIPDYLRFAGKLKIQKIIPAKLFNKPNKVLFDLFGTSNDEERKLLTEILNDSDSLFMKWAMNALISWKIEAANSEIIHIHGTKDKMLPLRFVKPDYKIEGGGHFMIYTLADKINEIIEKELRYCVKC